MKIPWF